MSDLNLGRAPADHYFAPDELEGSGRPTGEEPWMKQVVSQPAGVARSVAEAMSTT